ncbi:MAG: hypothetical protein K2I73_00400 [Eubacterium sp.]|nr:hypothetical protein [Eubacterium sp.]
MKKFISGLICIALIFMFTSCQANESSNINSNEPSEQVTINLDVLRNGTWYINDTKDYGPARGEGRYFDYINFLDEKTYVKTWLMVSNKSTSEYEIIDNYIILNDIIREDNLNGEVLHTDLICKIDSENLNIYAIEYFYRTYKDNAWEYIIEDISGEEQIYHTKAELIKNITNKNDSHEIFLKCQTDRLKNKLQSSIWTIQSWPSNNESIDEEYLSNAMYFSNDNMCYYWNSSNIDYDELDYFYTEFYDSTIYSIENNIITFENGKTLSIIEIPEEDTYVLADHTGCQYKANKNYSVRE